MQEPVALDCFTRILPLSFYFVLIEWLPSRGMWSATLKAPAVNAFQLERVSYHDLVQLCLIWDEMHKNLGGRN